MYRSSGLDAALFNRSNDILAKTLEGGKHLTRAALQTALAGAGIEAEGFRLSYLMMYAELEGLLCSGPRQGAQFTYALLEERAPAARPLDRPAALAELSRRYFTSRGPATLQDFVWWSGLTVKDAKAGIATPTGVTYGLGDRGTPGSISAVHLTAYSALCGTVQGPGEIRKAWALVLIASRVVRASLRTT